MSDNEEKRDVSPDIGVIDLKEEVDLRIITCGDVETGKSTLIDALGAGQKQDATISRGSRNFETKRRTIIVLDVSGDEQSIHNLSANAATADLAIVVIDARTGMQTQTRRHAYIAALLGVRCVVLAVNKMDLVDYSQKAFDEIVGDFNTFAAGVDGINHIEPIPISALHGDNIATSSSAMTWFEGPALKDYLDTVEVENDLSSQPFSMQVVNGSNDRGYSGLVNGGTINSGDAIRVVPGGHQANVKRLMSADEELNQARAGQSVTIALDREIEISRGDVLAAADAPPQAADQFDVVILWVSDTAMLPGRRYDIKIGALEARATITRIKHSVDVDSMEKLAANQLDLNDIAECNISVDCLVPFRPYSENRDLGGFTLIDRQTNETVGMGLIHFALRRAENVHRQAMDVDRDVRAELKNQKPAVLWFTGLSGSGKSTIANILEKRLAVQGQHTILLDGDNVRHGLNRDLGFTDADRVENIRRIGEVARLMTDAGLMVLVSFISPFIAERRMARAMVPEGEFVEIHVDTPLDVAEQRDVKGLYKKAREGVIKNFTGIDSPYEAPENPEIAVNTIEQTAEEAAVSVEAYLRAKGFLAD